MFSCEFKFPATFILYFNGKEVKRLTGHVVDEHDSILELIVVVANIILKTKHHET